MLVHMVYYETMPTPRFMQACLSQEKFANVSNTVLFQYWDQFDCFRVWYKTGDGGISINEKSHNTIVKHTCRSWKRDNWKWKIHLYNNCFALTRFHRCIIRNILCGKEMIIIERYGINQVSVFPLH